jgi:diguanylate cyclase (GGDEF)-like protein/PAS domain S-box-containing protein
VSITQTTRKGIITGLAFALYLAGLAVLFPFLGEAGSFFLTIPLVTVAWFYGFRWGLVLGFFIVPVNTLVILLLDGPANPITGFRLLGFVVSLAIGATVGYLSDTRRKIGLEDKLNDSEGRIVEVLRRMPILFAAYDEQYRIVDWNLEFENVTGHDSEELTEKPKIFELLFPDPEYRRAIIDELEARDHQMREHEFEIARSDGARRTISWSELSGQIPITGWKYWMVGVDVTERKRYEQGLISQAQTDELTGLKNRRYLEKSLAEEWNRLKREQAPLALMVCDIDHFKRYNDNLGHVAGDECLQKVARILEESIHRTSDSVSRFGGEEFVLLLPNTGIDGAERVAQRIHSKLQGSIPHPASPVADYVTLSIGVSVEVPTGSSSERLLTEADRALYRAKELGRNQTVVHSAD